MPEWQSYPINGTPAEKAVNYVLQRVVNDRNFSWYMIGTQTLRLCIQAEAHRTGTTEEAVEADLHAACKQADVRLKRLGADTADVCQLEKRIEALETEVARKDIEQPVEEPRRREPLLSTLPARQWWEEQDA